MNKTEVIDKVYDSVEAEYEIRNLKRAGYKRVQNCFWTEIWENEKNRVILVRDF